MKKRYCLIGKKVGEAKFTLLNHSPMSSGAAKTKGANLVGFDAYVIVEYKRVQVVINSLNKEKKVLTDEECLQEKEKAEQMISTVLRGYMQSVGKGDHMADLFIGHESNDVEIYLSRR